MSEESVKRVIMAKDLASRWLQSNSKPEHRLTIHYIGKEGKHIPTLLRGFRDGRCVVGSMPPIPDLGIHEAYSSVDVWSADHEAMQKLAAWFDKHGYETSGVW